MSVCAGDPRRSSSVRWLDLLAVAGLLLLLAATSAQPVKPAPAKASAGSEEEPLAFAPNPNALLLNKPAVLALAYAPDGKSLVTADEDKAIQIWDVAARQLRLTFPVPADVVTCLAFSPDGQVLATGSPDRTVRLWDVATGKEWRVLRGHTNWVYAVAFSPDGKLLASGAYEPAVRLWDPATGQERAALSGHKASVRAVAFAPDGQTLASGSGDRTVKLWDLTTLKERATLKGHEGTVRAVAFSPNGATLATAGEDGTVRLWDPATGAARATLKGSAGEVWALAFSPRGRTLATAGLDRTLRLWDPTTGQGRGTLQGHTDGILAVAFAAGGRQLATSSQDRSVRLWDAAVPPAVLYVDLQPKANQRLTDTFSSDNEGNSLASLPKGEQTLAGVKFQIADGLLQLGSQLLKERPDRVEGIQVGKVFARLHLLHATQYGSGKGIVADDTEIAKYVVHYEDGSTATIPVVYGKDVRNWWFSVGEPGVTRGKVAWEGENEATKLTMGRRQIRLYLGTWDNPHPTKRVVSLDYVKGGDMPAAPFCVAISLEEK
jgi:Tol biopolymer transport system component